MGKLMRLASQESDKGQVFKLLVTYQNRALRVFKYFRGHYLDLLEHIKVNDFAERTISTMGD